MPVHIIVEPELAEMHTLSCWPIQDPASKLILGEIQRRHGPNHYVVQRHRNRSCDFIAAENPGHGDRQYRSERNGVRRVGDRHQGHVVRNKPVLQSRQWPGQS